MYGGKFAFPNRLGQLVVGRKFTIFALFYFVFEGNSKYKPPGGLYSEGRFNGGFFCVTVLGGLYLEGLIHGGAYFRNFTVSSCILVIKCEKRNLRKSQVSSSYQNTPTERVLAKAQKSISTLSQTKQPFRNENLQRYKYLAFLIHES